MKVYKEDQYNQNISKYKLLSSAAGVGSIITTKLGYYILVSDVNKWKFVEKANNRISNLKKNELDLVKILKHSVSDLAEMGIECISDSRFINFLKEEKKLDNLTCLLSIPSMSLDDRYNVPNWYNHPIYKMLSKKNEYAHSQDFMIAGTHFPKWFKNSKGHLKTYKEWRNLWVENGNKLYYFAPALDYSEKIFSSGKEVSYLPKKSKNDSEKILKFKELEQTNLVLICPNGHLSDIPWSKYLYLKSVSNFEDDSSQLDLISSKDCCAKPQLKWTESKTKSDGYRSIFIECEACGLGSGKSLNQRKVNLEGITNLKPNCIGQKPWEIELSDSSSDYCPHENCFKVNQNSQRETMQVALVTGNNIYYSNGFSSLYIPQILYNDIAEDISLVINSLNIKYNKQLNTPFEKTREDWIKKIDISTLVEDYDYRCDPLEEDRVLKLIKENFLSDTIESQDRYEHYRWTEYSSFLKREIFESDGLTFKDVILTERLEKYFSKIQQISELKITQVQLDFTRVKPSDRVIIDGKVSQSLVGKNIYSKASTDIHALPANEVFGEGIFFQFNEVEIKKWIDINKHKISVRYGKYLRSNISVNDQGFSFKQKIKNNCYLQFLIHTFSHLIMRELEFSCGYPTSSLKERLYVSERMWGVLIYTAEGAEGSMGGLIWQSQSSNIDKLIESAISRASTCSSDPLCWESEGQGLFDLNLAACFSCNLTSETACEEMNLGLDRRILIDENFGFFKKF